MCHAGNRLSLFCAAKIVDNEVTVSSSFNMRAMEMMLRTLNFEWLPC